MSAIRLCSRWPACGPEASRHLARYFVGGASRLVCVPVPAACSAAAGGEQGRVRLCHSSGGSHLPCLSSCRSSIVRGSELPVSRACVAMWRLAGPAPGIHSAPGCPPAWGSPQASALWSSRATPHVNLAVWMCFRVWSAAQVPVAPGESGPPASTLSAFGPGPHPR